MAFHKSEEELSGLTPTAALATGTGTGTKGGAADPYLTLVIQLMAASVAGRDIKLFTFGDAKLRDDLERLHEFLLEEKVKVCDLVRIIDAFRGNLPNYNLFNHIEDTISGCFEAADENRVVKRKRAKKCCSLS